MNYDLIRRKISLPKASQLFLFPHPVYPYNDVVLGVKVNGPNGDYRVMRAVDTNSFISYRIRGEAEKIIGVYQNYFISKKNSIIVEISQVTSRNALDTISDDIRSEILKIMKEVEFDTKLNMLYYNRTRKIIDLYFENLVAMAEEFSPVRLKLVPMLYLPLDSKIFKHKLIFEDHELLRCNINRKATYGSLEHKHHYQYLQNQIKWRAMAIDQEFYPIYFDLFWGMRNSCNDRFHSWGNNLFQTNLGIPE